MKYKFKVGDMVETPNGVGEVLFIDKWDNSYLVGMKGFKGHDGLVCCEELVKSKGYKGQCWWFLEETLELIKEETKMNKYVKLLMEDLGLEVGEEFEIEEWANNPYHFDEKGIMMTSKGRGCKHFVCNLLYGDKRIKKIEKLPALNNEEIATLKTFSICGYNYFVRGGSNLCAVYERVKFDNKVDVDSKNLTFGSALFNDLVCGKVYKIDKLLEANKKEK